jgi:hypothetical protein
LRRRVLGAEPGDAVSRRGEGEQVKVSGDTQDADRALDARAPVFLSALLDVRHGGERLVGRQAGGPYGAGPGGSRQNWTRACSCSARSRRLRAPSGSTAATARWTSRCNSLQVRHLGRPSRIICSARAIMAGSSRTAVSSTTIRAGAGLEPCLAERIADAGKPGLQGPREVDQLPRGGDGDAQLQGDLAGKLVIPGPGKP